MIGCFCSCSVILASCIVRSIAVTMVIMESAKAEIKSGLMILLWSSEILNSSLSIGQGLEVRVWTLATSSQRLAPGKADEVESLSITATSSLSADYSAEEPGLGCEPPECRCSAADGPGPLYVSCWIQTSPSLIHIGAPDLERLVEKTVELPVDAPPSYTTAETSLFKGKRR